MNYEWNAAAEDLADDLIEKYHHRLIGISIAYIFKLNPSTMDPLRRQKPKRDGRKQKWAQASKVTDKYLPLMEKDYRFVIEFDRGIWDLITLEQQLALVDHELCHLGNDIDGLYMRQHDVEEFREIIERHGFWKTDVAEFAATIGNLFEEKER